MNLHRGDLEAREPLHLVGDPRAHGRGDLCEVQPVLDDDVQVEQQRITAPTRRPVSRSTS